MPNGRLQCVVFSGVALRLMEGVVVSIDGGPSAVTDRRGAAFLPVTPGPHSLTIAVPPEKLSGKRVPGQGVVHIAHVDIVSGDTTRVLATIGPDGALVDSDVIVPKPAAEAVAAAPEAEAAAPEVEAPALEAASAEVPAPLTIDVEEYVVRGRRIRGSVASVMEERRAATSVTDAIGAEDIRKSADGTASAATRRVVGATVVGGQYLFVRGLGGRYSNVRLNEVELPSTDPDVPGFQLDLFPASLLSSLTIAKTFTPDMPGDFAGGSMNIGTRDFPEKFDLSASLSVAADTKTLGRKMPTYDGGNVDFLGFDDGTRSMPDEIPDQSLALLDNGRKAQAAGFSPDEARQMLEDASRSFPNHWKLLSTPGLPQLGLGFSVGNTLHPGGHRAGYLFTFGYRYNTLLTPYELIQKIEPGVGSVLEVTEKLNRRQGTQEAQVGVLGTASYDLVEGQQLRVVSLLTQTGEDKASVVTGKSVNEDALVRRYDYKFTARRLLFNQLLGTHDLSPATLDWQLNMALIDRDQPDTRDVLYLRSLRADPNYYFKVTGGSGEHSYSDLGQIDLGGGANFTLPIDASKVKAGYLLRASNRDLSARRFGADVMGKGGSDFDSPPEELLSPDNAPDLWESTEATTTSDGYDAEQLLNAGYGLAELAITSWLKLTGGARLEAFHQNIDSIPPSEGATGGDVATVKKTNVDVLPSAGIILALTDTMSVRLAYGGTVARPLLRELSPAVAQDFVRRRTTQGEPALKRTYIQNFDARWELFPARTEVLAASVFYKRFIDPIETIIADKQGNLTYDNTQNAYDYGIELEARTGLGHLASALEDVTFGANFAAIKSQVELSLDQAKNAYSRKRPLAGQSPFVVNLTLGYSPADTGLSLNAFYNVFGRRIQEVGRGLLPDVYEEPFHSLDFTASYQLDEHWTLGATATNVPFQDAVVHQAKFEFSHIKKGSSFGVRLGYAN